MHANLHTYECEVHVIIRILAPTHIHVNIIMTIHIERKSYIHLSIDRCAFYEYKIHIYIYIYIQITITIKRGMPACMYDQATDLVCVCACARLRARAHTDAAASTAMTRAARTPLRCAAMLRRTDMRVCHVWQLAAAAASARV